MNVLKEIVRLKIDDAEQLLDCLNSDCSVCTTDVSSCPKIKLSACIDELKESEDADRAKWAYLNK